MSRMRLVQRCAECGAEHPKWTGRCTACGAWNSLVEDVAAPDELAAIPRLPGPLAVPIGEVDSQAGTPRPTGIAELDRVLGGGLVPGSVTLLGGEPGIGKSTLLLQLAAAWPRTLYVSAEESAQQVRARGERLAALRPDLWLLAETALGHILATVDSLRPDLVVVDSIQTVADTELAAAPGGPAQVRACAHRFVGEAKRRGVPVVLVGHVTKDNALAGPRVLEHVVDTVLAFEGDRHHALRLLRAVKHRFGAAGELGVFEMTGDGLRGVPEASSLFLADRHPGCAGSAVVPTLDGHRPLLVEVQALTNPGTSGVPPRRNVQGLDGGRLALLLAVLQQRAGVPLGDHEVFASAVGGVRLTEPGADLGVCLAIVSALRGRPLAADLVAFGEVGLGGELRQAAHASRRLAEAARLGFTQAVVPARSPNGAAGMAVRRVGTLAEALAVTRIVDGQGGTPH